MKIGGILKSAADAIGPYTGGTPFEGEELFVASLYLETGRTLGFIPAEAYAQISSLEKPLSEPCTGLDTFNFVDLFAGIGGFRIALSSVGGQAVFSSEWNRPAQDTYRTNFGEHPFGDINKLTGLHVSDTDLDRCIPDHDVLAAGFPCQPFSRAGVSARTALGHAHGFMCETQGTLFYSVERIARVKQPQILFLENVRNIVSHDGGRTFATIQDHLDRAGYKFFSEIIDSSTVVPQRRVRCYMVAVRKDVWRACGDFEFPDFGGKPLPLGDILERNPDPTFQISERLWNGHIARTERNLARGAGFTAFVAELDKPSNTIVARYGKDGKECLVPMDVGPPRTLTFGELKKLFGFPADFITPLTKSAAYRQFGNSVVVPVVTSIAENIVRRYLVGPHCERARAA